MSGGKFDYVQHRIRDGLEDFSFDADVILRFPKTAKELERLSSDLYDVLREIDFILSGDTSCKDDKKFDSASLKKLRRLTKNK